MERIAMSQEERDWLDWLKRARDGKITQREAAQRMGVSERWVRKLLWRMKQQGDAVVVHGLRGRPSNRKLSSDRQKQALAILKQPDWYDFGPTFAAQQLAERHRIEVGKETLRGWMIEAGIWKSRPAAGQQGTDEHLHSVQLHISVVRHAAQLSALGILQLRQLGGIAPLRTHVARCGGLVLECLMRPSQVVLL